MRLEYFQMVDRITALDSGGAAGSAPTCQLPDASPVFEGHFPGYPILSRRADDRDHGADRRLAGAGHAALRPHAVPDAGEGGEDAAFVAPGQTLEVEARLLHDGSGYAVVKGSIAAAARRWPTPRSAMASCRSRTRRCAAQMLETARRVGRAGGISAQSTHGA